MSELDEPAVHDQVVPLPLHEACAGIAAQRQISTVKPTILRIIIQYLACFVIVRVLEETWKFR